MPMFKQVSLIILKKSAIGFLFLTGACVLGHSSAYAAAGYINTYSDPNFCTELQNEMDNLTPDERSKDWPLLLRNKDIQFLAWSDINPKTSLGIIEKNDLQVLMGDPYINSADASHVHYIAEVEWYRYALPFYTIALKQDALKVQSASFISSVQNAAFIPPGKKITIIRYGVKPQLMDTYTIWDRTGSLEYYWTYFIQLSSDNGKTEVEYPISRLESMLYGELVIVDGQLSLFESSGAFPGALDEVVIPSSSESIVLMPACQVAFNK